MHPLPVVSQTEGRTLTDEQIRHWPLEELRGVHVEMGKQCNVRCVMCYQTDFSPATKATDIIWKERLLPAYERAKVRPFPEANRRSCPAHVSCSSWS
ncbi:hypothetical protein HZB60_07915 [candidate division KSB1 bacterium]|nr:hypothetical protein [candidate division KSB1 bacterium]